MLSVFDSVCKINDKQAVLVLAKRWAGSGYTKATLFLEYQDPITAQRVIRWWRFAKQSQLRFDEAEWRFIYDGIDEECQPFDTGGH